MRVPLICTLLEEEREWNVESKLCFYIEVASANVSVGMVIIALFFVVEICSFHDFNILLLLPHSFSLSMSALGPFAHFTGPRPVWLVVDERVSPLSASRYIMECSLFACE